MKAITIHEPWAWAIAHAGKRIENRPRQFHYRGELAIHAGLSRDSLAAGCEFLARLGIRPPDPEQLVLGAIVAVCRLVDCVPVEEVESDPWASGPLCLRLDDVRPLARPLPLRGYQGLWNIPPAMARQVRRLALAG